MIQEFKCVFYNNKRNKQTKTKTIKPTVFLFFFFIVFVVVVFACRGGLKKNIIVTLYVIAI